MLKIYLSHVEIVCQVVTKPDKPCFQMAIKDLDIFSFYILYPFKIPILCISK